MKVTWNQYKEIASEHISTDGDYMYRGQSDSSWALRSSIFRTGFVNNHADLVGYFNYMLPTVQEQVEAWSGLSWDLSNNFSQAEFLAYLQHNGFPTPLLDFTLSPYIAAYFAFSEINHFDPQSDEVAIFSYNQNEWCKKYKQVYDIAEPSFHASVLRPKIKGNHKLAIQQGLFLWSNVDNIEEHVKACEEQSEQFLTKYVIDVRERPKVIKELSLMGVSAIQLAPSIESVCKKAINDLIGLMPMGINNEQ